MSYSYIKSVFPKFENSNKVYDESLYVSDVKDSTQQSDTDQKPEETKSFLETYKNVLVDDYAKFAMDHPDSQNNLTYKTLPLNIQESQTAQTVQTAQTGQASYNTIPFRMEQHPFRTPSQKVVSYTQMSEPTKATVIPIEQFENESSGRCEAMNCDLYIRHISECGRCKAVLLKQFGIESDRIRNEEILELISYVIFGLFILLLLDYIKRNK